MNNRIFQASDLCRFAAALFVESGLPEGDARQIASDLVEADARGLSSHGVSRIPMYLERIRRGVVNPQPQVTVTRVFPAVTLLDGDNGMGFVVAHQAVSEAIALAKSNGIGLVGVRRSTHFGMSALYVQQATDAGYLSFVLTNSSPALPVWGGKTVFLGAAPMAAGVPGGFGRADYLLDMAMTVIARGKIRMAAKQGIPIDPGLALDKSGAPTTDASAAFEGVCLPFGGHKGAALAMLMDLLCGVLTGANYGGDVKSLYFDHSEPQNVGHLVIAMRPDLFLQKDEFDRRMADFVDRVKDLPKAKDFDEILIPGEPERRRSEESLNKGISLPSQIIDELVSEAVRLRLPSHLFDSRDGQETNVG